MAVRLAVHARLRAQLGALAIFDRFALFDYRNAFLAAATDKLKRGEYARRSRANDGDIGFHRSKFLLKIQAR
jgi:hypothetical protein